MTLRLALAGDDALVRCIADLRRAMRAVLDHHPMQIDAITVLPDTLHAVWTFPDGPCGLSHRIGMLKSKFSRAMPLPVNRTAAQIARGDKGIWQKRYWEYRIRNASDHARHCDLVHLSPVHAGLCPTPQDWPHSSIHRALRAGKIPEFVEPAQTPLRSTHIPTPEHQLTH